MITNYLGLFIMLLGVGILLAATEELITAAWIDVVLVISATLSMELIGALLMTI